MNGYSVKGFRDLPTFREMPRRRIAAIGIGLTMALVLAGLFYDKIPTFGGTDSHQAYFAEIGGLRPGDKVQISGVDVGKVSSIKLAGNKVRVSFTVDSPVPLGSGTRAAIVTTSVLGKRGL
ncbi:MlaD family protein, partial [Gordonia sp. (in: high G+C Gram-positive bacteria)]|uniref:MlaD family protein n=1 Tax=Gordonia sp. (in: high G+C Gram-positive bacteria) TaxID=84139 RepID=UPI002FD9C513